MNKTCGIIAEYNPFHNGHKFHLEAAKRTSSSENIVVVMSGNFVQRGEPAIICKFVRARMAILGGADVVLELPVNFATASAEGFARGAVYILEKSGIVDALSFGCETNNLEILSEIAEFLVNETEDFKAALQDGLRRGLNFPTARAAALKQFPQEILNAPNNILAIEYLKALKKFNSAIAPFGVARKGAGHHSSKLTGSFASASALRREILAGNLDNLAAFMPPASLALLEGEFVAGAINRLDNFSHFFHYARRGDRPRSPAAMRLKNSAESHFKITDIVKAAKTKNITHTALNRAALHAVLNLKPAAKPEYIRVLGFKRSKAHLISRLHQNSALPIITNLKSAPISIETEIKATKLYWLALKPQNIPEKTEFSTPMVII